MRPNNQLKSHAESVLYTLVVHPALMYGAETRAVKKAQYKKLDVPEMNMLRRSHKVGQNKEPKN